MDTSHHSSFYILLFSVSAVGSESSDSSSCVKVNKFKHINLGSYVLNSILCDGLVL